MEYKVHINTPNIKVEQKNLTDTEAYKLIQDTVKNNPEEHMLKSMYDKLYIKLYDKKFVIGVAISRYFSLVISIKVFLNDNIFNDVNLSVTIN